MKRWAGIGLMGLLLAGPVRAAEDLDVLMRRADLQASVRAGSESALVDESVALEQAAARAKSRGEYGLELRPRLTENDIGVGLRIYLPDRWNKDHLREQLVLVARSEQLRVAALEWQQLLEVYRGFCTYRRCKTRLVLYAEEIEFLEPWLEQADRRVEQHQLAAADRAKLYSLYLDLLNDQGKAEMELIDAGRRLQLVLGPSANMDLFAETAMIPAADYSDPAQLVRTALANRADFKRMDVKLQALRAAEAVAASEDGFRLKYIQPEYEINFDGSREQTFGISASIVLPWGTKNPDLAVYRREQVLAAASMDQHSRMIEQRLTVLHRTSRELADLIAQRRQLREPLQAQLETDMQQMDPLPLEQLRDLVTIRRRLLDTALLEADAECERQRLAVDFAEELGALNP